MAENFVDPALIQRALFVLSDKIQPWINRYSVADPDLANSKIYKLTAGTGSKFDVNEEMKLCRRQQDLFSDSAVTSPEFAHEVFKNNNTNSPKDLDYHITHNIILFIGDHPFYFNIDTVNYDNKKFYISNLNIKNESKNVLTLKSNYKISLKIHFTEFDDLLEKSIKVASVINPQYVEYIAPLQLLYKFFDFQGNQFGKSLADGYGIFLSQTLRFKKTTDAHKKLIDDLGGETDLVKNYHLIYYTHRFEMFKNEEPIFRYFENELDIEYISYETDGEDKPGNSKYVPKSSGNLYDILDEDVFKRNEKINNFFKDQIKSLSRTIQILQEYDQKINNLNNKLKCAKDTVEYKNRENYKDEIKEIKQTITDLKSFTNTMLILYFLNDLKIYSIDLRSDMIGVYEVSNFLEAFKESFNLSGLLTSTAVAVPEAIGAGTFAAGAATVGSAALVGLGIYAGYAFIAAAQAKKIQTRNIGIKDLRNSVGDALVTKHGTNYYQNLGLGQELQELEEMEGGVIDDSPASSVGASFELARRKRELSDPNSKAFRDAIQNAGATTLRDITNLEYIKVYFTTFGEILKTLSKLNTVKDSMAYVLGGYIIDIDITDNDSSFVNFYNMPISINSLSKFVDKQITGRDSGFKYDTDLFLTECYNNLVKASIRDGQIVLDSIKRTVPKTIEVHTTIHKKPGDSFPGWLKNVNLLDDNEFATFKKELLKSKNFNLSKGIGNDTLFKICIFGTTEELKYYDFYQNYANWAVDKNLGNKRFMYNTLEFQQFINTEHLIPCILMKNVSDSESILKKKYISFSRIDNPNMETGNFINQSGVMRKPYQFTCDMKANMSFFLDIGSYIFVSPPISKLEAGRNMFGFGGLYIVKGSQFEYTFQKIVNGNVTIPNLEAKYTLNGTFVTHGDSLLLDNNVTKQQNIEPELKCTVLTSTEPSDLQGIGL